jgi:hypothetical protein
MAELKSTKSLHSPADPQKLVAVLGKQMTSKAPVLQAFSLDDDEAEFHKIASFGYPGTGKTRALAGFLQAGERVFVANTDLGGNGLGTLKRYLKSINRADLLKNVQYIDLATYDETVNFIWNPPAVVPAIWDFDPTMLAWEGGSFFQTVLLDEKILSLPAVAKDGISNVELRNEGMFATQPDWNAMRRMTIRTLNRFLTTHSPARRLHKYMTFVEADPEKDDKGNIKANSKKSPLIYTAAKNLTAAGFDLIIQMVAINKIGGKETDTEYVYRTVGNSNIYAKNREFPIKPEEPADMERLWKKIKGVE